MKITRVVFPQVGRAEIDRVDQDLAAGPGQVVIRTLYTCVSVGTELAKYAGDQVVSYPFLPGNRAVGEVIEAGSGVTRVKPGDVVFTHTPHVSHARATKFYAPVPDGVPLDHASTVGMASVSITSLRVGRPELGDFAVVFGMGLVGNFAAQLYALSGAQVVAVDMSAKRLDVALHCGIPHAVNPTRGDVVEQVLAITGEAGAEYVVEATGNPVVFETACDVAKRGGEVVLLGSPRKPLETNITPLLQRVHLWRDHGSLTLKGAHEWRCPLYEDIWAKHSMERNVRTLLRLMQQGRLRVEPLISHRLPPQDAPQAFEGMLNDKDAWLGVIFDWT